MRDRKVGRKVDRKVRGRKVGDSKVERKYKIVRCAITTKYASLLKFGWSLVFLSCGWKYPLSHLFTLLRFHGTHA
jgi:hypothetical protein